MAGTPTQTNVYGPIVTVPQSHPSLTTLVNNVRMVSSSLPRTLRIPVSVAQHIAGTQATISEVVNLPIMVSQQVNLPVTVSKSVEIPVQGSEDVPQTIELPVTLSQVCLHDGVVSQPIIQQVVQVVSELMPQAQDGIQQVTLQVPHRLHQQITQLSQPEIQLKKIRKKYKPRKQYICVDCGRQFPQCSNLKAHMRTHTGEKPFACDLCEKVYRSSYGLKQHIAQRHEGRVFGKRSTVKRYMCTECPIKFDSSYKLKVHMRVHSGEKPFACSHCGKGFMQVYNKRRHERMHTGERPYGCSMCDKAFCDKSQLIQHTKNHLGTKVTCTFCEQKFTRVHGLNKHMQKVHPLEIGKPAGPHQMVEARVKYLGPMAAPEDYKKSKIQGQSMIQYTSSYMVQTEGIPPLVKLNIEDLKAERVNMPVTITELPVHPHACPDCPKTFTTPWSLKRHSLIHSGEKPHVCTECGHGFRQSCSLVAHMVTHTAIKPHVCTTCGKGFTKSYGLKEHMRLHTGEKPHICPHCSRAFRTTANLAEHIHVHSGVKRLKCAICEKTFNKLCNIKRHIRTHTGERPYVCSYCNRAFNDQGALKAHVRRHTGERPFKCPFCSMAFAQRFSRKVHVKRHHPIEAIAAIERGDDIIPETSQQMMANVESEAEIAPNNSHQTVYTEEELKEASKHFQDSNNQLEPANKTELETGNNAQLQDTGGEFQETNSQYQAVENAYQDVDNQLPDPGNELHDLVGAEPIAIVPINVYPHIVETDGTGYTNMTVMEDHRYPHVAAEVELSTDGGVGLVEDKPQQHHLTTDYIISVVQGTETFKAEVHSQDM